MIVSDYFPGDTNDTLKWIQHDAYDQLITELVRQPRARYLAAAHLIGVETELAQRLRDLKGFDHRVLQATHDTIAAYYRFAHDHRGQVPLPFDDTPYTVIWEQDWREFYHQEVARLTESDEFVRSVLSAVVYANTPAGYAAEDTLAEILSNCYDFNTPPTWQSEDEKIANSDDG